jgi:hypothetical protein
MKPAVPDGNRGERAGDRGVVRRGVGEGLAGQLEPEGRIGSAIDCLEQPAVVPRIDDHEHSGEVLRRRPNQRRPPDVDLLDEGVEPRARVGRRLHEGIQVDDDHVDQPQLVALERLQVVGSATAGEDAGVNRRVQRLDPPVQHFRETGQLRHRPHREARSGQVAGGTAGREELEAARRQTPSEFDQALLVRDAQQCSWHHPQSPVSSSGRRAGLAPQGKGRNLRPFFLPRRRPGLIH